LDENALETSIRYTKSMLGGARTQKHLRSRMGIDVICDMSTTNETIVTTKEDVSKTNENNVTSKEGGSSGAKTTSTLVNYEEVRRLQMAKL
jgi:hypothetical protein